METLDPKRLPRHVAVIMDGNGRWAQKRLRNRIFGHEKGADSVRAVVRCCRKLGISYLTLYAFSKENWNRPASEVKALWHLLKRFVKSELPELIQNEIRVLHLGDEEGIPADALAAFHDVIGQTAKFDKLTVTLALNYGGRQEIVAAARLFAEDVKRGERRPDELSPDLFARYLYTDRLPDPDLLIRTSGEFRVSNFLLWQLAYTEIYITNILWPDFGEQALTEALLDYQRRERRFGKTGEQLGGASD